MRSIGYMFGGNPKNLDDCLDLSLRVKPLGVSVDLTTNEVVTEMYILKQLIARFMWRFSDRNIGHDMIFGACFTHETEERQQLRINNANRKLEGCFTRIERSHIDVLGKQKRFDYSLMETGQRRMKI